MPGFISTAGAKTASPSSMGSTDIESTEIEAQDTAGHGATSVSDEEGIGNGSENAIGDDEGFSDWEDCERVSGGAPVSEENMFQRIDSRLALISRKSLLTSLMHNQPKGLASSSPNSTPGLRFLETSAVHESSVAASRELNSYITMHAQQETFGGHVKMISGKLQQSMPLSSRTTRRNMLSRELVLILANLLQERSTGNRMPPDRRHQFNDKERFRQLPEPGPMLSAQNHDFEFLEYHTNGW